MTSEESNSQQTPSRISPGQPPTSQQFADARKTHWHQDDKPLLSQEALRDWITRNGLLAYGDRALQLGAPAPSILEAVQGSRLNPEAALTSSSAESCRTLLARLIADGSVVPLNLLGITGGLAGDTPDFVASASVFSYIFTLRGAKAWKQPPATAGAVKVSPLALAIYQMLDAKVTLSAGDLATNLGKEITESAVLRALNELWGQLRVLPIPQLDGASTQWELASSRFTRQIKAGANAGQPSALSALISLYLGQAIAATEDEIETFLSPLAPRSRVRDVVHALLAARQLETMVIDGRTLLHVSGELPAFSSVSNAVPAVDSSESTAAAAGTSRISKFAAKAGSKIESGRRAKPAFGSKPPYTGRPGSANKAGFSRGAASGDRERRPFRRDGEARPGFSKPPSDRPRPAKAAFDKPWQDDRKPRPRGDRDIAAAGGEAAHPAKRTFSKPGTFGRKREGGFGSPSGAPPRRSFERGEARPPRRDFGDRPGGSAPGAPRREGTRSEGRSGFAPRPGGKPAYGGKSSGPRPFTPKPAAFKRSRPENPDAAEAPRRTFRKFDAPREGKPFRKPEGSPYSGRPSSTRSGPPAFERGSGERPPRKFGPSSGSDRPRSGGAPGKPFRAAKPGFGSKPAFGARPSSSARPASGGRPASSGGRASGGKPAFGGRKPPSRGGAPRGSSGGGGGFKPVKRKGPEGNR